MRTPITTNRLANLVGRTAAVSFLAAAGTVCLHAQQSAGPARIFAAPSLKASLAAPLLLSTPDDLNYSSSTGTTETANAESLNFGSSAEQPPPRRRYGRPNYTDSHTNPDGSRKYDFFAGGGFGVPTQGTHNDLTTGWGFQVGGGRNFNKKVAVNVQFDYDHFGFQTSTLNNLLGIYNSLGASDQNGNALSQLGGTSHVWSFTIDPKYTFYDGDKYGAYVVAGVGFYHKTANFTIPSIGEYFDPYYGPVQYQANQTIDKYTSNAPGVSVGIGATYKFSRFASERFYAEARYVYVANQSRPFGDSSTSPYFNVFPQNSSTTTYIPVKFGIQF